MTARDCLIGCQRKLERGGFYPTPTGNDDGAYGPKTEAAWRSMIAAQDGADKVLYGTDAWPWTARLDGNDILIGPGRVTWFGGPDDPGDNGETMSGIDNSVYGVMGCALAVAWWVPSTRHSPLVFGRTSGPYKPSIPWQTHVTITWNGKTLDVPLIDNGPAQSTEKICDLTPAAFDYFGAPRTKYSGTLSDASVRIIGGAAFVES